VLADAVLLAAIAALSCGKLSCVTTILPGDADRDNWACMCVTCRGQSCRSPHVFAYKDAESLARYKRLGVFAPCYRANSARTELAPKIEVAKVMRTTRVTPYSNRTFLLLDCYL
jgi:hypothetical protein